ncbi:MAG: NAD(P)H-binding protein [bacterium]
MILPRSVQVVTGAFSYLGSYIARRVIEGGVRVRTLTGHPDRENPYGAMLEPIKYHFDEPERLVEDLSGASTVYNTYWVRFGRGGSGFDRAVANSRNLIHAAAEAGVSRFVHISVTNPTPDSPYPYFRGKAEVEEALKSSGLSYAIIRPTLLFGREDILVNNIAYLLRKLPVFGIFGHGRYPVQPVYVDDVAELAVRLGDSDRNTIVDAVGPETFTYEDMVRQIGKRIGKNTPLIRVPPVWGVLAGKVMEPFLKDVIITRDEIRALMEGVLVSQGPATCPTRFSRWVSENADRLGTAYSSEVERHFK